MKNEAELLDRFGEFLVKNLRDKAIRHFDFISEQRWKAPALQRLQSEFKQFSPEQVSLIRECLISSIDSSIHDFLFAIQELSDFEDDIQVLVEGRNIVKLSEMLHGEISLDDGWFARFSDYGEHT